MVQREVGLSEAAAILTAHGQRISEQTLRKRIQRAEKGQNSRRPAPPFRRAENGRIYVQIGSAEPPAETATNWRQRAERAEAQVLRLEKVVDALLDGRLPR